MIYSELNDYDNIIPILEKLILNYPKKQYWLHLTAIYAEKKWMTKHFPLITQLTHRKC